MIEGDGRFSDVLVHVILASVIAHVVASIAICWNCRRRRPQICHESGLPGSGAKVDPTTAITTAGAPPVTFVRGADGTFTLSNGTVRAVWETPPGQQATWVVTYGAAAVPSKWVDVATRLGVQIEVRTVEPTFKKWEDRFLCGTAKVGGMPKPFGPWSGPLLRGRWDYRGFRTCRRESYSFVARARRAAV